MGKKGFVHYIRIVTKPVHELFPNPIGTPRRDEKYGLTSLCADISILIFMRLRPIEAALAKLTEIG